MRFCIRPLNGTPCSWPSWISARVRSHSRKGPERPVVPPDQGRDGETVSPSPQSNSQTSAGIPSFCQLLRISQAIFGLSRSVELTSGSGSSRRLRCDARFVAASLHQHRQGDPRQLVRQSGCQNVVMQALRCGPKPRSEAVFCPACRSEQNNAGALHEKRAQIALATHGRSIQLGQNAKNST